MSFLEEALALAKEAENIGEVPVGAVVVHAGKVIGRGYNRREIDQDPLAHAEIAAIHQAARALGSWRLENCELYCTLEPCPHCLAACQLSRVSRVVYGAADPKGGAISLGYRLNEDGRLNHRFEVRLDPVPECGSILSDFFAKLRGRI